MIRQSKVFISLCWIAIFIKSLESQEISDLCLGCICHASSGCNQNQGCTEAGVCGPFLITWPFWADAGKFVLKGTKASDSTAYSGCTTDFYCASETVRGYARKFAKDCNNDGVVDCEDFGRIHRNGPGNCGDPGLLQTEYYKKFAQCKAQVKA